jgi:hypothetical protein
MSLVDVGPKKEATMIRTVWLALFFLVSLGAMFITKGAAPRPAATESAMADQSVQDSVVDDRLTKADRLDVSFVRETIDDQPSPSVEDVFAPVSPGSPESTVELMSRPWHHSNAKTKMAVVHRRKIKKIEAKRSAIDAMHAKTADAKVCARLNSLTGLLRKINLAPQCSG